MPYGKITGSIFIIVCLVIPAYAGISPIAGQSNNSSMVNCNQTCSADNLTVNVSLTLCPDPGIFNTVNNSNVTEPENVSIENSSNPNPTNSSESNSAAPRSQENSGREEQNSTAVQSGSDSVVIETVEGTTSIVSVGSDLITKQNPIISGNLIVWEDLRYIQDIYLYNIETGEEKFVSGNNSFMPFIYGDRIIYTDSRTGNGCIYLYNISTGIEELISPCSDGFDRYYAYIDHDRVVYMDNSNNFNNIVYFNISTNKSEFLTNTNSDGDHISPAIFGDWVVWYNGSDDEASLYLYNIVEESGKSIESHAKSITGHPASIYQDRIVWEDIRNAHPDIYLYNITTGDETLITRNNTDSDCKNPFIFNDLIVWDRTREGHSDIFLYNMSSGSTSLVTPDTTDSSQTNPKISDKRIVWQDSRSGLNTEIYLFTIGDVQLKVSADFSINRTLGDVPFTVQFSDKSTGKPSNYYWNFGDGNMSQDINPIHTYYSAGLYSPSLIVSNPYSRDYKKISDPITAGATPSAQFSYTPQSGLAPLSVNFKDLATGYPTSWKWEFGDNTESIEENPTHIYTNIGNFTVIFQAANQFGNTTSYGNVMVVGSTRNSTSYAIPGLVYYLPGTGDIEINRVNETSYSFLLNENETKISILPNRTGEFPSFILTAKDGTTFSETNSSFTGTLGKIDLFSENITSIEFDDKISNNSWFNYSFQNDDYSPDCSIETRIFKNITQEEFSRYLEIIELAHYADNVAGVAYATRCDKNNITETGPATITMSVSHEWIVKNSQYISPHDRFMVGTEDINGNFIPFNTQFKFSDTVNNLDYYIITNQTAFNLSNLFIRQFNSSLSLEDSGMKIIDPTDPGLLYASSALIAVDSDWVKWNNPTRWDTLYEPVTILHIDDNGNGEVLNTTHLYYDPVKNLDVFKADSPNGLSEFALTTVSRSGNPLQLLYLSVLNRVAPPAAGISKSNNPQVSYGGGGGGGSGSYGGSGNTVTPSSSVGSAEQSATPAPDSGTAGSPSSPALSESVAPDNPAPPAQGTPQPVSTNNAVPSKTPAGPNVGGFVVPIPNSSVFSLFIEAAAMISVVLIVVFSTFTRYRRKEKD
jgi:beta propeller repeat protein